MTLPSLGEMKPLEGKLKAMARQRRRRRRPPEPPPPPTGPTQAPIGFAVVAVLLLLITAGLYSTFCRAAPGSHLRLTWSELDGETKRLSCHLESQGRLALADEMPGLDLLRRLAASCDGHFTVTPGAKCTKSSGISAPCGSTIGCLNMSSK